MKREPWHYDALKGRPDWSKELARKNVMLRQRQNLMSRRKASGQ